MVNPRLTWDDAGTAPFESAWSLLVKIQVLNAVSLQELRKLGLIPAREAGSGGLFASHLEWDIERIAKYIGVDASRLLTGFTDYLGFHHITSGQYEVRHCPECSRLGYHCTLFNVPIVYRCPWHDLPLATGCTSCAHVLQRWYWKAETGTFCWRCPECNYVAGLLQSGRINQTPLEMQREVKDHCIRFVDWWRTVVRIAGEASPLIVPLVYPAAPGGISYVAWRLSWATGLSSPPHGWGIPIHTQNVRASLCVPLAETKRSERTLELAQTYQTVRNTIFRRYVRMHRECLTEIMEMGPFERISLDVNTLCTVCVAFVSWRAAHEGCLSFSEPNVELHVRAASLAGVWADRGADKILLHANFVRIWAEIEETIPIFATRIVRTSRQPEPVNVPSVCVKRGRKRKAICLLPDPEKLSLLANERCARRQLDRAPMWQSAAAYANSGWNAVVDAHLVFVARNHQRHHRNTYSYIYV